MPVAARGRGPKFDRARGEPLSMQDEGFSYARALRFRVGRAKVQGTRP